MNRCLDPHVGAVIPPLGREIFGWMKSKGIQPTGAAFWRYRVIDMDNALEIDFGVPVATAVEGDGRIIADAPPAEATSRPASPGIPMG